MRNTFKLLQCTMKHIRIYHISFKEDFPEFTVVWSYTACNCLHSENLKLLYIVIPFHVPFILFVIRVKRHNFVFHFNMYTLCFVINCVAAIVFVYNKSARFKLYTNLNVINESVQYTLKKIKKVL